MPAAIIHRITLYPLSIPMRTAVHHAAAVRDVSEPVLMEVELLGGLVGWGETLPRPYVTGESIPSVIEAIRTTFIPRLIEYHPESFPEALEALEALPWVTANGEPIPAARAAVELALLDATLGHFQRDVDDVVRWMGLPGFGSPGSLGRIRFSGVLAAGASRDAFRRLKQMYWAGIRNYKLKVGMTGDKALLAQASQYLQGSIRRGRATLRVDANGAWNKDEAIEWVSDVAALPIRSLEQPLPKGCESDLPILSDLFDLPLVHDESLVTMDDARRLKDLGVADAFNIRLSKCGGLLPSLRLAAYARRNDIDIQLGCMVGETSVLSAAGLCFLRVCPNVEQAEGCFGTYLLSEDVVPKSLRFGYAGRPPRKGDIGLGITVDPARLRTLCSVPPIVINL